MRNLLRNLAYSAVILAALSVVLHEMSVPAVAQSGGSQIVAATGDPLGTCSVYASNGDVYTLRLPEPGNGISAFTSQYRGNVFTGAGPTPTKPQTWSGIKGGAGH